MCDERLADGQFFSDFDAEIEFLNSLSEEEISRIFAEEEADRLAEELRSEEE